MNDNLAALISDYQASVRIAVDLIRESGFPIPVSDTDWACNDIEQTGELIGGYRYFKHGYGCKVRLPSGLAVDFDFGEHGQINGFDPGRLALFAGSKLADYGFSSEKALKECIETELAAGSLVHSGYILYYIANAA